MVLIDLEGVFLCLSPCESESQPVQMFLFILPLFTRFRESSILRFAGHLHKGSRLLGSFFGIEDFLIVPSCVRPDRFPASSLLDWFVKEHELERLGCDQR